MESLTAEQPSALAELIAEHFPAKPAGYLDTASIGLVPAAVGTAVTDAYEALGMGTRGGARWRPVVQQAHELYAAEFGVTRDEVAFMASTGEAMNAIAHAVHWAQDDEVLVLDDEFPTVVLPWTGLDDFGVRVVRVDPLPGDDRLGALLAGIGPRTRVVAVSHVSSFTGTRVDLAALGAACAEAGALLVCDGAQAAGCIAVDLDAVDFYIATGYKWLLGGFGVAVLVAKQAALERLHPRLLGHGNDPPSPRLTYGHLNIPGVFALHAAAKVRQAIGVDRIHQRVAELAALVHAGVTDLGFTVAGRAGSTAAIVSLADVPSPEAAAQLLAEAGVAAAVRGGYLRISPHVYSSESDITLLLDALAEYSSTLTRRDPR